jgi:hypothetical protein
VKGRFDNATGAGRSIGDIVQATKLFERMRSLSKWGGILTDYQIAAAMIDRLIDHGHLPIF